MLSYFIDGSTLEADFETIDIKISLLKNKIAEIEVKPKDQIWSSSSDAVIKREPVEVKLTIEETETYLFISDNAISVYISKNGAYLRFADDAGKVFLEEETGLGVLWTGNGFAVHHRYRTGTKIVGLGEKSGPLDKMGRYYVNQNTDHFGYGENSDPLYASIPFYIAYTGETLYGLFLDNPSRSWFDFGASQKRYFAFGAEFGPAKYYIMHGNCPGDILNSYLSLVGKPILPPKWALGYQQCRYSYYPDQTIVRLAQTFDEKDIPLDMIYLDIHYMDGYKVFTWHPKYFPDPTGLIHFLRSKDIHLTVILDPGIKKEKGYEPYESGEQSQYWITYPDGNPVEAEVWPGTCVFPDFAQESVKSWWAQRVRPLWEMGIQGFWNDMNEPAVWGNRFPEIAMQRHRNEVVPFNAIRNLYGMHMNQATRLAAPIEQNPFILTRAAFAGSHRYAALWTGDNSSHHTHLALQANMVANLSLAGFFMAGGDVGGFIGECTPELFMRWIALGSFQGLFRSHTMINSRSAEPWSFGEEAEQIARQYIKFRYRLLPWWYSLFVQGSLNGIPPCTSLFYRYYDQEEIYDQRFQSQFIVGDSLLLSAGDLHQNYCEVYLPKPHRWYDLIDGTKYQGGQVILRKESKHHIPLYIAEGSILILNHQETNRSCIPVTEIEIHLFGLQVSNQFTWYDCVNGELNPEPVAHTYYTAEDFTLAVHWLSPLYERKINKIILYLHDASEVQAIKTDRKLITANDCQYIFFKPVQPFDPYDPYNQKLQIKFGTKSFVFLATTDMKEIKFVFGSH